ncbi:MAG: CDP-alcohol phosphatidyltransferase family protein [Polyangiaceae bacterium]
MAEPPEPKPPRPPAFAMFRTFVLADFITLGNAAAGMGAILCCLAYVAHRTPSYLWTAFGLFPVALLADVLDGFVARWRRKQSPLGADLDSLADIVSFGVAPAVLGYAAGLNGGWDGIIFIYFVACGISRLARFNVTAAALMTDEGKVSHFEGTPIPTSMLLVALLAIAFSQGAVHERLWWGVVELGPWGLHPLALLYFVSGSAMVSQRLRIPKP